MFFWNSCFLYDPADVGNLISGSSASSKTSLNIWKFMVYVLLKPGLENFELYFTSVWDECNCAVVWAFFGIAFLWDWNENWPFPILANILNQFALNTPCCSFCSVLVFKYIRGNSLQYRVLSDSESNIHNIRGRMYYNKWKKCEEAKAHK